MYKSSTHKKPHALMLSIPYYFCPQSIIFSSKPLQLLGLKRLIHCSKQSNSHTTILLGTKYVIPTNPIKTVITIMIRPKEVPHYFF